MNCLDRNIIILIIFFSLILFISGCNLIGQAGQATLTECCPGDCGEGKICINFPSPCPELLENNQTGYGICCTIHLEVCDLQDNDCDGEIDEGFGVGTPCDGNDADLCQDGIYQCSANGLICTDDAVSKTEKCNGIDDDCDGEIDEDFPLGLNCDGEDSDNCFQGTYVCDANDPHGYSCTDPDDDSILDVCNGQDDDCNPDTADGSDDTVPLNTKQEGVCEDSEKKCDGQNGWVDDYSLVTFYEDSEETCDDGYDNDCDGLIDCEEESCACKSCGTNQFCNYDTELAQGSCETDSDSDGLLKGGSYDEYDTYKKCLGDCIDSNEDCESVYHDSTVQNYCKSVKSNINPLADNNEVCFDGIDNDCDGLIDCADKDDCGCNGCFFGTYGGQDLYGLCADGSCLLDDDDDGFTLFGTYSSQVATEACYGDCNDNDATIKPGQPESICFDGIDNDCDSPDPSTNIIDCNDPDCNNQQCKPPLEGTAVCVDLVCKSYFDNCHDFCNARLGDSNYPSISSGPAVCSDYDSCQTNADTPWCSNVDPPSIENGCESNLFFTAACNCNLAKACKDYAVSQSYTYSGCFPDSVLEFQDNIQWTFLSDIGTCATLGGVQYKCYGANDNGEDCQLSEEAPNDCRKCRRSYLGLGNYHWFPDVNDHNQCYECKATILNGNTIFLHQKVNDYRACDFAPGHEPGTCVDGICKDSVDCMGNPPQPEPDLQNNLDGQSQYCPSQCFGPDSSILWGSIIFQNNDKSLKKLYCNENLQCVHRLGSPKDCYYGLPINWFTRCYNCGEGPDCENIFSENLCRARNVIKSFTSSDINVNCEDVATIGNWVSNIISGVASLAGAPLGTGIVVSLGGGQLLGCQNVQNALGQHIGATVTIKFSARCT